jgi:hypothetical protein
LLRFSALHSLARLKCRVLEYGFGTLSVSRLFLTHPFTAEIEIRVFPRFQKSQTKTKTAPI